MARNLLQQGLWCPIGSEYQKSKEEAAPTTNDIKPHPPSGEVEAREATLLDEAMVRQPFERIVSTHGRCLVEIMWFVEEEEFLE
jgi:hypothetical protein